ncbi:ABC transporter substrate-binding protein [Xylanimonas sp. McL0601]|uniref:ABC transporter substrate-binding protein n=1 Tax=Xylanimonas sp. McL0601 TaxID=3414739 RepID=UPI003CF1F02B
MKTKIRVGGIAAMAAAIALVAAGCSSGDSGNDASASGDGAEITWWHNGTGEPLLGFWNDIAKEFMAANPGVTVNVQAFQNEELRNTVLPNAFAGGNAPDLFQSWGGGELVSWVEQGIVKDLSDVIPDTISAIGGTAAGWQVDGKTYGLPFTFGPAGFWVNKNLWTQAGLDVNNFPTTMDELTAAWAQLKDAGIAPVAVGGGDTWPAAHWWYHSAVKTVSPEALQAATASHDFSDPAWATAGENLQSILDAQAFNQGWQATSAQQGAASSAGMVVTGQAAMELMGVWDAGVMGGIYNEANNLPSDTPPPDFLGWFPFPAIEGGAGEKSILGGGDGFSVHADAPAETAKLLEFILSKDVQTRYAAQQNIPVTPGAESALTFAPLQQAAEALHSADYVQLWLDTAFGPEISAAMNPAIVAFMGGQGTPQDVVAAITAASPK